METRLPDGMTVWEIFRGQGGDAATRQELLERLNAGPALVNYLGHGSVEVWRGGLLTSADARMLTNGPQLPVVVSMTCLNGFFHDVYTESLAEALLKADAGGAVARVGVVRADQSRTAGGHEPDPRATHLRRPAVTLGGGHACGQGGSIYQDIRRTWMLFGDPTMRVR